jgi:hypothetical protein
MRDVRQPPAATRGLIRPGLRGANLVAEPPSVPAGQPREVAGVVVLESLADAHAGVPPTSVRAGSVRDVRVKDIPISRLLVWRRLVRHL